MNRNRFVKSKENMQTLPSCWHETYFFWWVFAGHFLLKCYTKDCIFLTEVTGEATRGKTSKAFSCNVETILLEAESQLLQTRNRNHYQSNIS